MVTPQPGRAGAAEQVAANAFRIACPFGDGGVVHVYYVDAPEPALVDTGVRASASEVIAPALAAIGRSLAGVRHIFNTHGHWDHMGGNGAVRAIAKDAKTYVARADEHLLQSVEAHWRGYSSYPARILKQDAAIEALKTSMAANIDAPTPIDVYVTDGAAYTLGDDVWLRAIATPGHSHGSTSYLLEGAGLLFTGDGVQGLGSRPGQLPLVFEDSQAYRATIAKLAETPLEALCMGHSFCGLASEAGRDPVRRGNAARAYLEESGEAAKAVEEALRSAIRSVNPADFIAVAKTTLAALQKPLGIELDADGLSARSIATLHAFYRELTGAPKPS